MASDVTMPRLSDSMEEGTVLKWLIEEGGEVKRGEPLVEIETDKANMTYDADSDGVLVEIVAQEGDTLPIGEVIARIGEAGEAKSEGGDEEAAGDEDEAEAGGEEAAEEGQEEAAEEGQEEAEEGDEAEEEGAEEAEPAKAEGDADAEGEGEDEAAAAGDEDGEAVRRERRRAREGFAGCAAHGARPRRGAREARGHRAGWPDREGGR
jgi:pyruvate dehydrogenase E2 component (dihydrolipoyllysine-residue acetyltransferase)